MVSAVGGAIGGCGAFFIGLIAFGVSLLICGWPLVFAAVGAVVGVAIGTAQWLVLRGWVPLAGWWITVNALGGMLGGMLAVLLTIPPVPLLCSAGPVAFGAVTGAALLRLLRDVEPKR